MLKNLASNIPAFVFSTLIGFTIGGFIRSIYVEPEVDNYSMPDGCAVPHVCKYECELANSKLTCKVIV